MSFITIAIKYNGPLQAAHAHIDDDSYDMVVQSNATGKLKSDTSDQLRSCNIALTYAISMSSADMLHYHRHQV